MARSDHAKGVFLNCPFDNQYAPLFQAITFAVLDCGFRPRCALEVDDASEVRFEKIARIIAECKYGIHDICRTQSDAVTGLPRFNMPLELGMFLGAKKFGTGPQQKKVCLILDALPYRYQQFISDIAGQDVQPHNGDPRTLITVVRNWLRTACGNEWMPGGAEIYRRYLLFMGDLAELCVEVRLQPSELTFKDLAALIARWLLQNA
jgi:hypothetical protein